MVSQASELSRFATLQRCSLGLLKETGRLDGSPVYRGSGWRGAAQDSQVIVGIDEELEIRPHFFKSEFSKIAIRLQSVEIRAPPCFEGYEGVAARFATGHAHDFQQ